MEGNDRPRENLIGCRALPGWEYRRPRNLGAALTLLQELPGSLLIAGGTDVIPALRSGRMVLAGKSQAIDISALKELDYIRREGDFVRVGALTRLAAIAEAPLIRECAPGLAEAAGRMASLQIRHQGTLGGNLGNASPAADTAPPLLILEATVTLRSVERERHLPLSQFFRGPGKTAAEPGEMVTEVRIPVIRDGERSCSLKLGRRSSFTLSVVSVAALVRAEGGAFAKVRVACGAVAPWPMRALKTEAFLSGKPLNPEVILQGADIAAGEVAPIADVRASAEYRREMTRVLTRRALLSCLS